MKLHTGTLGLNLSRCTKPEPASSRTLLPNKSPQATSLSEMRDAAKTLGQNYINFNGYNPVQTWGTHCKSCVTITTFTSHPAIGIITFHSHEEGVTKKHKTLHKDTHINMFMYLHIYIFTNKSIWSELDDFQRQKLKETQLTDDYNICKYLHLVMMCCISPVTPCATSLYGMNTNIYIYIFILPFWRKFIG